jgi:Ca2+/H+ antiporter
MFIGGAIVVLCAVAIMLPAIIGYVAGIGRLALFIVVAIAAAYFLNLVFARRAIKKMREKNAMNSSTQGAETEQSSDENPID